MIQMYFLPGKELCLEQGRSFVNSRLIGLMENAMAEYAQIGDDSYMEKITSSKDWEKPLETIIDLNRMRKDENFVTGWLREYELIPQTIGSQRGLQDFFSLYDLLKAKRIINQVCQWNTSSWESLIWNWIFAKICPNTIRE